MTHPTDPPAAAAAAPTARTAVAEGTGVAVADHDTSYLEIAGACVGEIRLARAARLEVLRERVADAFAQATDAQDVATAAAGAAAAPAGDFDTAWFDVLDPAAQQAYWAGQDAAGRLVLRAEYRAATGREFPRVYRLRLALEAEELSEAEARAYWAGRTAAAMARRLERR